MLKPLAMAGRWVMPGVISSVGLFRDYLWRINMARVEKRVPVKLKAFSGTLPFTKLNYQILGAGILCIILGYVALAQEPWNGTIPLVIAPILLMLGYCVIIPVGILFRKRIKTEDLPQPTAIKPENSH